LGRYTQAQEVFKETAQELSKDITTVQSQVNTVTAWLDKYEKMDLTPQALQSVTAVDSEQLVELDKLDSSIKNIETTNKKITQNNTYKQLQAKIKLFPIPEKPTEDTKPLVAEAGKLNTESVELSKTIRDSQAFVKKIGALHGTCPTCLQEIDEAKISELIEEQRKIQETASNNSTRISARISEIDAIRADITKRMQAWESASKSMEEWEKYHSLIDTDIQEDLLDKNELESKFIGLQKAIATLKDAIAKAEKHNLAASAHNAKIDTISKQIVEMNEELETYSGKLHELSERMLSLIHI
jgi:uncharacterized coiled-coil DUF342 family protein